MSEADDHWLLERIVAVAERQDRTAFADLFRHLMPRFAAFALAKGAAPAHAEEMAQETMLMIWRNAASYDPAAGSPMAWIYTIARNKRIDLFRRESRPTLGLDEAPEQVADEAHGHEELYRGGRTREFLQTALTALSPEQRIVIEKAFVEGKTHSDVANELDLPLGTVKSRIRLGLVRMRQGLPEDRP